MAISIRLPEPVPADPNLFDRMTIQHASDNATPASGFSRLMLWPEGPRPPEKRIAPGLIRSMAQVHEAVRGTLRKLALGEARWPLLLFGPTGTGKTRAALCLCDYVQYAAYWTMEQLLNQQMHPKYEERLAWQEQLRRAELVVLDEIGERALEVALKYADANPDTEIVVVSAGPESAAGTIRKGLAMGAASALQVADEGLLGADLGLTAQVLAAAVQRAGFDLVIAGNQSTDGSGGMIGTMVAELLDVPQLSNLVSVDIAADAVSGTRAIDGGVMAVTAPLPAVISITEQLPDARFPNFKGIMAAKKKPFDTVTLADLGIDPEDHSASRSIVIGLSEKPPREAGVKIVDEGDAGEKLAEFLAQNRLV